MENNQDKKKLMIYVAIAVAGIIGLLIISKNKKEDKIIQPPDNTDDKLDKKLNTLKDEITDEIKKIKLIKVKEEKKEEKKEEELNDWWNYRNTSRK